MGTVALSYSWALIMSFGALFPSTTSWAWEFLKIQAQIGSLRLRILKLHVRIWRNRRRVAKEDRQQAEA